MKKSLFFVFLLMSLCGNIVAQMPQYYVAGGTSTNVFPFSTSDRRIQNLYVPADFNAPPPVGFITKIYYRSTSAATNATYSNFEVQLTNSPLTAFPSGTYITPMTTVIGPSTSYVIPTVPGGTSGGTTGWAELPLTTPFFYDNTQSLIVDVKELTASNGFAVWFSTVSGNRRIYGASAATTGTPDAYRYDFGFDIIAGFPCTGVPTSGLSGPSQVCPNKNFTVSFTTFYTGVTRQWQKSTNGTTWTNFTGTINSTTGAITDAITVPSWYRCIITCTASGQSFTTAPHFVDIAPFYYCYCDGSKATSTAAGMDVGNVTIASVPKNDVLLNNGSASPFLSNTAANKSYSDFRYAIPPIPMYHDSAYRLLVSQTSSSATFTAGTAAVYIDLNRNGTFDVAERVLLGTTTQVPPTPGLLTDTVIIPNAAGYGLTGMRVILNSGSTPPDTCASYTDGETEDYLVDLRYLPCDTVSTAGIVEGDTSVCTGYDYLLTDTTYQTKRYGLTKLWQRSADGIGWADIAGSAPKDTLMRLFTGQPLFYRLREVCTITNDTAYSPVHKVNLKAAYKCYCFSQAVGGSSLDSSDIGGFKIYNFEVNDGGTHLGNPRAVQKRQDFTDLQPIELLVDSIYQFHVFHTMPRDQHGDAKVTMFMDFNNNHKYDIPQERVYTGFTDAGYHTIIDHVLVLDSAIVNTPTGLRVILNNDVAPNVPSDEACGTYTSGETEDYMVVFKRPFLTAVQDLKTGIRHMQLYPNPTSSGKFMVRFYSNTEISKVRFNIVNVTGQQILQEEYTHAGGLFTHEFDLTGKAKGVYFLEVDTDGIKTQKRVVVQ